MARHTRVKLLTLKVFGIPTEPYKKVLAVWVSKVQGIGHHPLQLELVQAIGLDLLKLLVLVPVRPYTVAQEGCGINYQALTRLVFREP